MPSFNQRLKELRLKANLSQQLLADRIGISKSSINMYERGEREPGIETLEAFADFFNVDMNYLIGYSSQTSQLLNDDEYRLISAYRQVSDEIKKAAQAVLMIK